MKAAKILDIFFCAYFRYLQGVEIGENRQKKDF